MSEQRQVVAEVLGAPAIDGDGVHLVRVLGPSTISRFDPILMLDSFDSTNPKDYERGFPMHPHRGIETISYVYRGRMQHKDSTGGSDTIGDGEVQWMTAGSGILHEERIPHADRLLGVQLWLNLPAKDKMVSPAYYSIKNDEIPEVKISDKSFVRVLSGTYEGVAGFQGKYVPLDYYDIHLAKGERLTVPTVSDHSVMLFLLKGNATVSQKEIKEKTAVKLSEGDHVDILAHDDDAQILFMGAPYVKEPVVWGGPIVMNTSEELSKAFSELSEGTFIKEKLDIS